MRRSGKTKRRSGTVAAFAVLLGSVAFSNCASAIPNSRIFSVYPETSVGSGLASGESLLFGGAPRVDRMNAQTVRTAAQNYFDFDAIITLGSLALAGGALGAVAIAASRRKSKEEAADERHDPASNWRDAVLRNLEADLTAYARTWRRAA